MGESDVAKGRDILEAGNIPVFRVPENAVTTFMNMYKYTRNTEALYETPATIPHRFVPEQQASRDLINKIVAEDRFVMTEDEAKALMRNYEIPVTNNQLVHSGEQAAKVAAKIGFPVVMKVASPQIAHKSDIGGVVLNITTKEKARNAYKSIMENSKKAYPDAHIEGVLLEEMVDKKYELIIGSKKDPIFGPVIIFGMGGVAVEVFKDLNVGLPPLNMALAMRLIEDTKIYRLLKGYRGMKQVDMEAIQFLLYKFAYLVMDFPEIKEIDINPFAVDHSGGVVLDAKVVLDEEAAGKINKPYSHLVISPYPKEHVSFFTLKNGQEIKIRPVLPEDEPLEEEMFANLSRQTQYYRFFGYLGDVTHDMLVRYTQIDYDREIALVGLADEADGRAMTGVVRLVADAKNEEAEFAIVVADKWQGQGLGNHFTDLIMAIAKERGIRKITATVLQANTTMLHMFRKRGFIIKNIDYQTSSAELLLESEEVEIAS
jgi:acetyltransferase